MNKPVWWRWKGDMGVKGALVFHHSKKKKKDTGIDPLLRALSSTLARTPPPHT